MITQLNPWKMNQSCQPKPKNLSAGYSVMQNRGLELKGKKSIDIGSMTVDNLKQELSTHGLNTSGSRRVLVTRLEKFMNASSSIAEESESIEKESQRRSRPKGCDEDFGSVTLDVVNCTARVKEIWREMQTLLQKDQNNGTNQSLNLANGSDLDSSEQVDDRDSCRKLLFPQEIVHLPDASDKNVFMIKTGKSFHKEKWGFLHEIKGIGSRASCQDASQNLCSNNKMNEVNSVSERIPELLDSEDQEIMKSVPVSATSLDNTVFGIDGIELKKRDETVRDENSEDERPEAKVKENIFIERSKSEVEIAKVVIESGVCSSDGIYNNEDKESVSQYEEHVVQADEIDLEDDSDHDFQWQPDSDSESEKGENAEMSTVWKTMNFAFESCKVAYFIEPSHDCIVECLPTCSSETNPPKYPPIKCEEYLSQRYKETHSDLSKYK